MFYISSATKTSTLSTRFLPPSPELTFHLLFVSTICFKSSGTTFAACTKRKRKRDIMSELIQDAPESIKPSRNSRMDEEELEDVLEAVEKKRRTDIVDDVLHKENEIRISPSVNEDRDDMEETHNLRDPRFLTMCNLKS